MFFHDAILKSTKKYSSSTLLSHQHHPKSTRQTRYNLQPETSLCIKDRSGTFTRKSVNGHKKLRSYTKYF